MTKSCWCTRVRTDIHMRFSRTFQDLQRPIQGFSRTQKSLFPGLSRKRSIQNISYTRSKSAYTKPVINVSALKTKEAEMQYLRPKTWHCIKRYCLIRLSAQRLLKSQIKKSRSAALEFQDFPGFSRTFQAWNSKQ